MMPRWLIVASVVLVGWSATVAVARPAANSGEPEEQSRGEPAPDAAVTTVPARVFIDPESPINRMSSEGLSAVPDHEPSVSSLSADGVDKTPRNGSSSDAVDGSPETSPPFADATELPEDSNADMTLMMREGDKKLRINSIQTQIISYMGWGVRTPSPNPIIKTSTNFSVPAANSVQKDAISLLYKNANNFPAHLTDSFTEKTQSFYPTCNLPRHTNEEVWKAKVLMNLMFNISLPKAPANISVNVNSAKLRLFKQLVFCNSQANNETDDSQSNCEPTLLKDTIHQPNVNLSTSAEAPLVSEDRQIRVSIFAYTRSLKRNRVKKKLLDSRMMSYFGEKWTEWNIRSAILTWRQEPIRNYGLSVEVEDEDGNLLPANRFFKTMNCTGDAQMMTPKPIPGFLMEAVQYGNDLSNTKTNSNISSLQALGFNVERYPMVDVTTVEIPNSEANQALLYQYTKYAFEHNLASKGAVSLPEDRAEHHRIRHNNHHRANYTDMDMSAIDMSKIGQNLRDQIIVQGFIQKNPGGTGNPTLTSRNGSVLSRSSLVS